MNSNPHWTRLVSEPSLIKSVCRLLCQDIFLSYFTSKLKIYPKMNHIKSFSMLQNCMFFRYPNRWFLYMCVKKSGKTHWWFNALKATSNSCLTMLAAMPVHVVLGKIFFPSCEGSFGGIVWLSAVFTTLNWPFSKNTEFLSS